MALVANAGLDALGAPHALAASGHFLRPPDGGPGEVRVEVMKRGRTASTARATRWQHDRPCLVVLVTAGALQDAPVDYDGQPRPSLPAPEECTDRPDAPFHVALLDHVDVRLDPATVPFPEPNGTPVIRGWMAFRDGADADALALLLAVDAMPPTVFHLGRLGWAPTVELTFLLRAVPAPGWLAFEAQATLLAGNWFDEQATVWDSTGRLVAQARQLALAGRG
jgi:acyl-CoA thioesterase